jgi:hypothetical protein
LPHGFEAHPVVEKPYAEEQLLKLIGRIFDQTSSPTAMFVRRLLSGNISAARRTPKTSYSPSLDFPPPRATLASIWQPSAVGTSETYQTDPWFVRFQAHCRRSRHAGGTAGFDPWRSFSASGHKRCPTAGLSSPLPIAEQLTMDASASRTRPSGAPAQAPRVVTFS